MASKVLIFVATVGALISISKSQTLIQDLAFPYFDNIPFPYDRYLPINLNSSTARPIAVPPLVNTFVASELEVIENIGRGVFVRPLQGLTSITGGVLLNDKYIYALQSFNWDGVPDGRASSELDGSGTPLQTQIFFYNSKYGSFENALKFPDGVAVILLNIMVHGTIPNPEFIPLEEALKSLKVPGSRVVRPASVGQIFINALGSVREYYSYPGTYIQLPTLHQYLSATIIQIPEIHDPVISVPQFMAFTSLLDSFGQPTTNVLSLYPQGNRPVVQALRINVVTLP